MHTRAPDVLRARGAQGRRFVLAAAQAAALAAFACSVESEDPEDPEDAPLERDEATAEIVQNLRLAGNPEAEIEVRDDGRVWLGGDAVVSLGASREMLGLSSRDPSGEPSAFRQYRTTNLIDPAVAVICIDGTAYTDTLSEALDAAIASYEALGLWFDLVRTDGSDAGCDAEIVALEMGGNGGLAGFPAGGLPYDRFYVGTELPLYGTAVATHVITHELGHCIGLRHTDYFDRSISCGIGGNEGDAGYGAIHIPGTPTGAAFDGSVMNACFHFGSTGVLTPGDVVALLGLYSPSPSLCRHADACGGQAPSGCWCDSECATYGDCCADGPCAEGATSCLQSNACGDQTPSGCWCDASCVELGDCCLDGPC